ncbi:hypothetical protein ACHQM5_004284 [Ranunculus cassubicifolius]
MLPFLQVQPSCSSSCFTCGEPDHWKDECPWVNYPCLKGCGNAMRLFTSGVERTKGLKFLRCESQPHCNGFIWLKELEKVRGNGKMKEVGEEKKIEGGAGKIKLEISGLVPMSVEGDVSSIAELVKKLSVQN